LAVQLLREELDPGESEAVVLAKELSADLILIDECAATRRARMLGLTVTPAPPQVRVGTLGVLLLRKQAGHVSAIKPLMEQLRDLDFHMSADLYNDVLDTAGEAN
jgi:predicted nucleic acid-binding protein